MAISVVGSSHRTVIVWVKFRFTYRLPVVHGEPLLHLRHARELEDPGRPALDRTGRLRGHAEHTANLSDRSRREVVVPDVEQVDAVVLAHHLAPADPVGEALVHAGCLDVTLAHARSKKPVSTM